MKIKTNLRAGRGGRCSGGGGGSTTPDDTVGS